MSTGRTLQSNNVSYDILLNAAVTDLFLSQLEPDALVAAIRALEALAHERTVARLKISEDVLLGLDDPPHQLPYDPASVFLLETMVSITSQAPQYIEELW
jgi:brefeldin A-resistance guanine nucleotide exchange factor 1